MGADDGNDTDRSWVGRRFGQLEIRERLGRGGMGEVYRAYDSRLGREVAVKVVASDIANDPIVRRRFVEEIRLASQIVHPYVATVFDVVETPDGPLLVMEMIEGRTLSEVLNEGAPGPQKALAWAVEIAEALAAIHAKGLIHRDLKPGNLIVTDEGHIKLTDFGVARSTDSGTGDDAAEERTRTELTAAGAVVGTYAYMSPEQLCQQTLDARSDLFSLGIVLFETCTGHHPFRRGSRIETASAVLHDPPGSGDETHRSVATGPLAPVLLRLLEKRPEDRYQSAQDVVEVLHAVADGTSAPAFLPEKRTPGGLGRAVRVAAILALVGAVVFVAGSFLLRRDTGSGQAGVAVTAAQGRHSVAVLPVVNRTAEPGLGRMLSALLTAALGESGSLRSIADSRVEEALEGLAPQSAASEKLRRLSGLVPTTWIVSADVFDDGGTYLLTGVVHDAATLDELGHLSVRSERTADLASVAANKVHELVRRAAPGLVAAQLAPATSVSDAAQRGFFRARELAREQDLAPAIRILEDLLYEEPDFTRAAVLHADLLFRSGYDARAREAIASALRRARSRPTFGVRREDLELRAAHAQIHLQRDETIEAYRDLSERFPEDPEPLLNLAGAFGAAGRHAEALSAVEDALALDDADPRLYLAKARTLARLDRFDDADAALAESKGRFDRLESRVGPAELARAEGDVEFYRGDNRAAADAYERATVAFRAAGVRVAAADGAKSEADLRLYLWDLERAEQLYGEALPVFQASGSYGRTLAIMISLGTLHLRMHEFESAERYLLDAIDEARKLGSARRELVALTNLATGLSRVGRTDEAAARARAAVEIAESLNDAYRTALARIMLAEAAWRGGRHGDGVAIYDEIAGYPGDSRRAEDLRCQARLGQAEALLANGDPSRALWAASEAFEIARRLDIPERIGFASGLRARALAQLGRIDEAEADLAESERRLGDLAGVALFAEALDAARAELNKAR